MMISTKEKRYLIFRIIFISLLVLGILFLIRILYINQYLEDSDLVYVNMTREILFSLTSMFITGVVLYKVIKTDIQKINEKAINYAFTDVLTGLYNRRYLNDFLEKFTSLRKEDANFAIAFIDIDNFKKVNDTLGHTTGDCILKYFALKLQSLTRSKDIICRYGGDEFIIVLSDISAKDAFEKLEEIRVTSQNMLFHCKQESITISAGLSFGSRGDDINMVMEKADRALYAAKDAGRNCVKAFTSQYEN